MRTLLLMTAIISAQPLVSPDVLEPSVVNEVEHALSRAPTNLVVRAGERLEGCVALGVTNGLDRTQMAIRLVSQQAADGHWRVGTNDYSSVAVGILRQLLD